MATYVKQATAADLSAILAIYRSAEQVLANQQIPQWQNGSGPSAAVVATDIHLGRCYLLLNDKQIAAVASLTTEKEEAYEHIHWHQATTHCYGVVHRFAVRPDCAGRGMGLQLLTELASVCEQQRIKDLRIDTHPKNLPMQKLIKKAGFDYRGQLMLPIIDGERQGYQLLLN